MVWKVFQYLEPCETETLWYTARPESSIKPRTIRSWSVATSSCHGHVDELATEPFLLLHREHGTGYWRSWNCCNRRTRFVVIWKYFCFILSTGTKIRIDSVMRPRSSSRGRTTSASVTVYWLKFIAADILIRACSLCPKSYQDKNATFDPVVAYVLGQLAW